jgi:hypothetical protein
MDLARELSRLDVAWPETPELRLELAPRRRSRRWVALAAAAVAIAALAAALAVPQSRGAILRFFHLGAAKIEVVDTLPPAESRPLEVGLGPVVPLLQAQGFLGRPLLMPPGPTPRVHNPFENVVAMVFRYRGEPVLLSEFGDAQYFKKAIPFGSGGVREVLVGGAYGVWLPGAHNVYFPGASPRLAGPTLVWTANGATYRLEGKGLTREGAIALAESLETP